MLHSPLPSRGSTAGCSWRRWMRQREVVDRHVLQMRIAPETAAIVSADALAKLSQPRLSSRTSLHYIEMQIYRSVEQAAEISSIAATTAAVHAEPHLKDVPVYNLFCRNPSPPTTASWKPLDGSGLCQITQTPGRGRRQTRFADDIRSRTGTPRDCRHLYGDRGTTR